MNIRNIMGMLVGSVCCYVALAACGGDSQTAAAGTGGTGGAGSSGSTITTTSTGSAGTASTGSGSCTCVAEPRKPEVVVEKCSHHYMDPNQDFWYAVHEWPGATMGELGTVFILEPVVGYLSPEFSTKAVYGGITLGDGKVERDCLGPDKSVTFVKP
jgi:hypothetical protein